MCKCIAQRFFSFYFSTPSLQSSPKIPNLKFQIEENRIYRFIIYFYLIFSLTLHDPLSHVCPCIAQNEEVCMPFSSSISKGPIGRRSGKLEEWKISGRIENIQFSLVCVCLVGGMEKLEGRKLFYLIEKKNKRIENVVYIN